MESVLRSPSSPPDAPPPASRRFRTVAGGILLVVSIFFAGLLALGIALHTGPGRAWLGARLGGLISDAIPGEVRVHGAAVRFDGIHLEGVEVFAPDGTLALSVERVEAAPLLSPRLARLEARVLSLRLVRPRVLLETPPGGGPSSLVAAFVDPAAAPAADTKSETTPFSVELDRLVVEDGAVVVRERGLPPTVSVAGLAVEARVRADGDGAAVAGTVAASFAAPFSGEAGATVDAALDGGYRHLALRNLELRQGGATAAATGGADLETLEGELRSLTVNLPAADAHRLVPAWQPGADLRLTGTGRYRGGRATASLALEPGGLAVEGEVDLARQPAAFLVKATGGAVELRALQASLPPAVVAFTATAEGRELPPSFVRFEAEVKRAELGGVTLGPARAAGSYDGGDTVLETLAIRVPGASATGGGRVDRDGAAALRLDLTVGDAAAARRALVAAGRKAGLDLAGLPELDGEARFSGRLDGSLSAPVLAGRLRSDRLVVAGTRFATLAANISLHGLPDHPAGTVDGTVAALEAGELALSEVRLDLRLAPRRIDGTVGAKSRFGRLEAELGAAIAAARDALDLERLRIAWPGAAWQLERPAKIRLSPRLAVDGLALAGTDRRDGGERPGGRLEASGRYGPGASFTARVLGRGIELGALPKEVIPESLGLAGRVDLDADVAGTTRSPRGTVGLTLSGGAAAGVDGLGAKLAAELGGGRARGTLDLAWAGGGGAEPTPARAARQVGDAVGEVVAGRAGPSGTGLAGSGDGARAATTFDLPVNGQGRLDARAAFEDLDLARVARLVAFDRPVAGTVAGELVLAGTAARPEIAVRVDGAALDYDGTRAQRATLQAAVGESPRAPRGRVNLVVEGLVTAAGRAPVDADVTLLAGGDGTTVDLVAKSGAASLATAHLAVAAPPEGLAAGWETAALEGRVDATAVDVALLAALLGLEAGPGGTAGLEATIGGTAARPTAHLALRGDGLRLDRDPLGRLAVVGSYGDKQLAVEAVFEGASGGNARLAGKWTADLGAGGIRNGSLASLAEAPLDLALVANRFDVGFLAPLHPDVRQLEGTLDADLRIRGQAPTPELLGTVDFTGGRLGYTNLGDLRDLNLGLTFEPDRFRLRRLTASSTGTFEAVGEGVRTESGGPFALDVKLVSRNFGLVASDVLRARLDLDARLTGTVTGARLEGDLELTRGKVTLPDTPSKTIQPLEDHPDFVIVRGGEDRVAARERAAREAIPAARTPSAWDSAGLQLAVKTKRPLPVEGTDVSLTADVDLRVHATREAFALAGRVQTVDGHVVVMNRRFEVERGRVIYGGRESPGNPRLDVVAAHPSPYAKVTVHIGGSVEDLVLSLRSEPAMSEAEIATLLATGRPQLKRGGGGVAEASGAASAIGALLSDQLKKGIASKLPVDVISFQAGEEGVFEGSTLEAGSYLTDRVYVGYQRLFTEEEDPRRNQNEVRVEYQLAPRWTLESSYGDHAVGGVDLFWTRDF